MKIVFISKCIDKTGITTHMLTLGRQLVKMGHEVYLITSGCNKNNLETLRLFKEFKQAGIKHRTVKFPLYSTTGLKNQIKIFLKYILVLPKAMKVLREIKPDIIHLHYFIVGYIPKIYNMIFKRIPSIATLHKADVVKTPLSCKADACIAISEEVKPEIINKFKYSKVYTIYNGTDKVKPCKRIKNSKPNILFVGSLERRKGLDILIDALKIVAKTNPNFTCTILGDGGVEWVNQLIQNANLQEFITLVPFQDPQSLYKKSDIFVLPSRVEGFALVVIEAMMNGLPVIRSNTEGASVQIVPEKTGYIFENENSEELANYILKLLEDENLRLKMGKKGYKKAITEFSSEIMAEKTIAAYKSLIKD
ncbi:hypothetical protein AN396_11705 [Candidatus Epulonipiscium fishelsonii]|uniref:Uncharacterized protein n=1 Tax=Candidatus Epulonipiscium fishelsonii TaxID=77094 RepID=A0ACC8X890_9FIRM|nr:hypothetical protein AN396_11705 [Epulopiscium sp. SCG-B11WGA-EpuloA1]